MTFETGDVPFAGTDATVFVQLFGEKGNTEKIEFPPEEKRTSPRFDKGRVDKFAVETMDIGKVRRRNNKQQTSKQQTLNTKIQSVQSCPFRPTITCRIFLLKELCLA